MGMSMSLRDCVSDRWANKGNNSLHKLFTQFLYWKNLNSQMKRAWNTGLAWCRVVSLFMCSRKTFEQCYYRIKKKPSVAVKSRAHFPVKQTSWKKNAISLFSQGQYNIYCVSLFNTSSSLWIALRIMTKLTWKCPKGKTTEITSKDFFDSQSGLDYSAVSHYCFLCCKKI